MPLYIWFSIIAFVLLIIVAIYVSYRADMKIEKSIKSCYGKPPEIPLARRHAVAFWESYAKANPTDSYVDDITWQDLEMDAVYAQLNTCQSALGDIRLYNALRRPLQECAGLEARETIISTMDKNPTLRMKAQFQLARLGRWEASSLAFVRYFSHSLQLRHRNVYRVLGLLPLLCIPIIVLYGAPGLFLLVTFVGLNVSLYTAAMLKNESGFISVRYVASSYFRAEKLARILKKDLPEFSQRIESALHPLAPLSRSFRGLAINDLLESNGLFDPTFIFFLPLLRYAKLLHMLQNKAEAIDQLYDVLGEIDLAICLASLRESLPLWTKPAFSQQSELNCKTLYHPLLETPVPNSACFAQDVLLTGSNASGKSTFIKALALNCIFAQSLNTCTAESFSFRTGVVASAMAVSDSTISGDSYFVAEIKSMQRLVKISENSVFSYFFIDEILKGTNTIERVAAASSVLAYLSKAHCLCFAATHDIELTTLLQDEYRNYHFSERVQKDGVFFDYKLHSGPACSRNAILLLEGMQFPIEITAGARALVKQFEDTGVWG